MRPTRGPASARVERPFAARAGSASASPVAPREPTAAEYAVLAKEMELQCAMREGDPRSWRESSPNDCDDFDMQANYSFCTWGVRKDEQGIRAASQWARRPDPIALPFQPRSVPKHEVARCAGDTTDDSGLPEQRVSAFVELDGGTWGIVHSLDLAGAPTAFLDETDGILVLSRNRLVRISNASKVEILYRSDHGLWRPSSIVKDADGTLYIGGMYVVVRLRPLPVGYAETWLAPLGVTRPRPPE